ncbi:MAG: glycoside hydrolase [Paludibacteraceae bacterium]|nr:glycoside hydrolase [Paludibacteraceae bacterium]
MKKSCLLISFLFVALSLPAQQPYWWGAVVGLGHEQPYTDMPEFDLSRQDANNQIAPLFLSSEGEYMWNNDAFSFSAVEGQIISSVALEKVKAGNTLREAYMAAQSKYFPASGLLPDTLFFTHPQYNTWIELMYNQNQEDILRYAHSIIDNGFPTGVLMIDDNWQRYYGNFKFKAERFTDAKAMIDELHSLGFKVMVWICPFVSPDSPEYRFLADKGYLLRNPDGGIAILNWWNGYSACYDLTNPEAADYFVGVLREAQAQYGIDGFKLDAGDNNCYASAPILAYDNNATTVDHTVSWAKIGLQFPFNEYRACWKMGGQPLVQRLGDKDYSWEAVRSLIPQMCVAGLLGYAYACPDMVGGGQFTAFLNINENEFDQALIVRSAQVHALMPMMQFSVAPWRILSEENLAIVRQAANLHKQFGPYIMKYAHHAAATGEPIVRCMEYQFPHQGFALVNDQFMLGDKYLVAPVVTTQLSREVKLPKGVWRDEQGKRYKGGKTYKIDVPLSRLPYFERIK